RIVRAIERLRESGVGIIYISHRLEEVLALADRVTVLRDGESMGTRVRGELKEMSVIQLMIGGELASIFSTPAAKPGEGDVALELRGVSSAAGVRDVSLTIRRGEILG